MLIQIEEPGLRRDPLEDAGLALGVELGAAGLRAAAAAGGNAELLRGPGGALDFLPAVAGYDPTGMLAGGAAGLADASAIGAAALADPDAVDRRGASATRRLAALIEAARRQATVLTGRPVLRAVAVVPADAGPAARAALLQAVESAGLEPLALVDRPVAVALGGGLAAHGPGAYLLVAGHPEGAALARLEVGAAGIRLAALDVVPLTALAGAVERPIAGVIAPGVDAGGAIAAGLAAPLLDGFAAPELAVLGAALLAEALAQAALSTDAPLPEALPMPKMIFIDLQGNRREVDAPIGLSVLEIAHKHGVDLEGACEGSLACSTCHVIIDPAWFEALKEPSEDEEDMLDLAFGLTRTSRLGCQIVMTEELDGLTVSLPPGSRNMQKR